VLSVLPRQGFALVTEFSFSAAEWRDDLRDLPLRYLFAFNTAPNGVEDTTAAQDFQVCAAAILRG
jgi:hypothetical protein